MNYPRYTIVFLVVAIGVGVVVSLINASVADSTLGSSAQLMVPAMIGAVIEGQSYVKTRKAKPKGPEAWNFAWIAAGIATVLNVALAYLAGGLLPEFGKLAIAPAFSQQFLMLLGFYAGGYLICNRLLLSLAAGNQFSLMVSRGEIE